MDPYQVLGVSRDATEKEITAAYRKLAKKYHPDLNPGDAEAARKMGEINAAYDSIKNGTAQAQYSDYSGTSYGGYYQNTSAQSQYSYFDAVENYIRSGYFREAYNVLQSIQDRNAKWYYYSAVINSGLGNSIAALEHARKAVELEPSNMTYRSVLNDLENGGSGYYTRRQTYGAPVVGTGFGSCCAAFILFRFLSSCCCRPF